MPKASDRSRVPRSIASSPNAPPSDRTTLAAETEALTVALTTFDAYAPAAARASAVLEREPPAADDTEPPTASAWYLPSSVAVKRMSPAAVTTAFSMNASTEWPMPPTWLIATVTPIDRLRVAVELFVS